MTMLCMFMKVIVFDLDDTLYKEIDFLKSGYRKVAELVEERCGDNATDIYHQLFSWYCKGENPFVSLNKTYGFNIPIDDYLSVYRYHRPLLALDTETEKTLTKLKEEGCELAIITDGREMTQRQKIEALGLTKWISTDFIFINEDEKSFKPNRLSFERLMFHCHDIYKSSDFSYYYVGDNPQKDFFAPNQLGWCSVCLIDDGRNIHKQVFGLPEFLPHKRINSTTELLKEI